MDDSLFTIQRYTGENDVEADINSQSVESEKKLLKKLQEEVALRKKARSAASLKKEGNDQDIDLNHEQLKNRQRLKSSTPDHPVLNGSSKRHRKKKRKEAADVSRNDTDNLFSSNSPVSSVLIPNLEAETRLCLDDKNYSPHVIASKTADNSVKRSRLSADANLRVESSDVNYDSVKKRKQAKSKPGTAENVTDSPAITNESVPKHNQTAHSSASIKGSKVPVESGLELTTNKRRQKRSKRSRNKSKNIESAEVNGFTVIGKVNAQVSKKVKRVLPEWLTSPTVITADLQHCQTSVEQLAEILHPKLLKELKANGIVNFFPVQFTVIPWLLKSIGQSCYRSNDICVSAPTGSGKTLAFVLPIIQALLERVVVAVRALVVLPVRELALQVYQVFQTYCRNTGLKVGLVVGKSTFADEQKSLVRTSATGRRSLVDIVVATPGKLVDHILKTQGFSLSQLKFLVIDEADRVMEEIKQDWLQFVEQSILSGRSHHDYIAIPGIPIVPSATSNLIPSSITPASTQAWLAVPQKLLFSATLSQNPAKLQALRLFQPKLFTSVVSHSTTPTDTSITKVENSGEFLGKYTTPAELEEYFVECDKAVKPLVLYHLLTEAGYRNVLCFTNSVDTARRLYLLMKAMTKLEVREVTARLIPSKRTKILTQFKQGKIDLIVCSDALARGMDFDNVRFVVSYDSPEHIKTYIHRIGRTARAGKSGTAVSFLDKKEVKRFQKFLTDAGKQNVKPIVISDDTLEKYEERFRAALQEVGAIMNAA